MILDSASNAKSSPDLVKVGMDFLFQWCLFLKPPHLDSAALAASCPVLRVLPMVCRVSKTSPLSWSWVVSDDALWNMWFERLSLWAVFLSTFSLLCAAGSQCSPPPSICFLFSMNRPATLMPLCCCFSPPYSLVNFQVLRFFLLPV